MINANLLSDEPLQMPGLNNLYYRYKVAQLPSWHDDSNQFGNIEEIETVSAERDKRVKLVYVLSAVRMTSIFVAYIALVITTLISALFGNFPIFAVLIGIGIIFLFANLIADGTYRRSLNTENL